MHDIEETTTSAAVPDLVVPIGGLRRRKYPNALSGIVQVLKKKKKRLLKKFSKEFSPELPPKI